MTKLNLMTECTYSFNFDRIPDITGTNDKVLGTYGSVGVRMVLPDYHPSEPAIYTPCGMSDPVKTSMPNGSSNFKPNINNSCTRVCSESRDYTLPEGIEFELFKNMLLKNLPEHLPPQTSISIQRYLKENGKVLHGLTFTPPRHLKTGECPNMLTSPVIYIDNFFKEYIDFELGIKEICMLIAREYIENQELPFSFDVHALTDYKEAREHLVLKLINHKKSAELLTTTPHMDHEDLSLIVSYVLPGTSGNEYTCTVSDKLLRMWDIDKEQLFADATVSSERILPLKIRSMTDFMNEINSGCACSPVALGMPELYILTNNNCNSGASSLFYKNAAEKCLSIVGGDYYILPSSIHELLLISKSCAPETDRLRETVEHVNLSCVKDTEYLSGNVYSFNFKTHTLEVV